MAYSVESPTPFGSSKNTKIMCVDTWDAACCTELNANAKVYSIVQFYRDIPRGMLDELRCEIPLNVSIVGKTVSDISGLQDCHSGIASLIVGLIAKKAVETAPLNKVIGLESLRVSYIDGIQLRGLQGSSCLKKLVIDEVAGLKNTLILSKLPSLEHLRIIKLGSTSGIDLADSEKLSHLALRDGKFMREIQLPGTLPALNYVSLEKVPCAFAEQLAKYKPKKVELEAKDIFKSKTEAQKMFITSEILWS